MVGNIHSEKRLVILVVKVSSIGPRTFFDFFFILSNKLISYNAYVVTSYIFRY